MATRVELNHFSLAQLKQPTPKTSHRERIACILSLLQAVCAKMWGLMRQLMAGYC